ncbi:uncharacterized protein LOC135177809 [Pogoniulus pusillus]|uniref:uncharacterized protein LOC135177809 n=1 Tax=Pogoniulus pusillus TaxID=488313 RepID=UPI0030B95D29
MAAAAPRTCPWLRRVRPGARRAARARVTWWQGAGPWRRRARRRRGSAGLPPLIPSSSFFPLPSRVPNSAPSGSPFPRGRARARAPALTWRPLLGATGLRDPVRSPLPPCCPHQAAAVAPHSACSPQRGGGSFRFLPLPLQPLRRGPTPCSSACWQRAEAACPACPRRRLRGGLLPPAPGAGAQQRRSPACPEGRAGPARWLGSTGRAPVRRGRCLAGRPDGRSSPCLTRADGWGERLQPGLKRHPAAMSVPAVPNNPAAVPPAASSGGLRWRPAAPLPAKIAAGQRR